MAHLIPPHGTKPVSIVLTKDEALIVLATLNKNATYSNRHVRRTLMTYIDRLSHEEPAPLAG